MEDDWEANANRDGVIHPAISKDINKWKGEDEEDDVKDSWEDEEEKKDEEKPEATKTPTPIKTKISKAKLAEQERLAEEEEEKRIANLTPEEKLAEKLRLQKIQEESDINNALETFGISNNNQGLDSYNPQSKEEFKEFGTAIRCKLAQYRGSPHFPIFIEDLVRSLCVNLSAADIKRIKIGVETLYSEKLKVEKQSKKPAAKGKVKATLRKDDDINFDGYAYDETFGDDYDDFM